MKYKLIASDCDDTLFDSNLQISPYTCKTIHKYVEAGGKFVIATGRMKASVMPYCKALGLKGELISFQGALISDIESGKDLESTEITYLDAYEIVADLEAQGVYCQIYDYSDSFFVAEKNEYTEKYAAFCKATYVEAKTSLARFIMEYGFCPVKIMAMEQPEKIPDLIAKFRDKYSNKFLINSSKSWLMEIIPILASKGLAVERLAKKYGIKREEVICIGDSSNDLPMIEYAGLGVVVNNGDPVVKEKADYICPSNDDDGVAFVINEFGFLE